MTSWKSFNGKSDEQEDDDDDDDDDSNVGNRCDEAGNEIQKRGIRDSLRPFKSSSSWAVG